MFEKLVLLICVCCVVVQMIEIHILDELCNYVARHQIADVSLPFVLQPPVQFIIFKGNQ